MDTTLHDPLVGRTLDGRYRVDARIAVGGMATVYRAVDTRLDRVLALKVMHPNLAADTDFVQRFIREAKSIAGLAHPNVVGVFDQGTDGSYVYLAMEYVAGCTLRDVLRERGALQPRAALDILEPVLAALGGAHRAGFVHRDMKPENVLIGDDGRVKVADFGLVRAVNTNTTTTGAVLGTVSYLAPEQIEHGAADPRVDVYACGVMLFEMLTGGKPHQGESPAQVLYQRLHEDIVPPSDVVPDLAPELDGLVLAAADRAPLRRPADAVELLSKVRAVRAALTDAQLDAMPPQALADGHDGGEDRTSVVPRPAGVPAQQEMNATSRLELPPPSPDRTAPAPPADGRRVPRRGLVASLAALALVLVAAGVWYINSGQFTKVPSVLGQQAGEAETRLADAGLKTKRDEDYSNTVDRGQVIDTAPKPASRIREGTTVTLIVSKGPRIVTIPDLSGVSLSDAKKQLTKKGLRPGRTTREFDESVPRGSVMATEPGAGTDVRADRAIAITVSKGAPIEVPDVVGEDEGSAMEELREEGLEVEIAPERVFSEEDSGTVAEQSPGEDEEVAEGDTVTLTISKGQDMVEVPDVEDLDKDEARRILEEAGFKVKTNRYFIGNTVQDQSVEGGDEAPRGSEITLWLAL